MALSASNTKNALIDLINRTNGTSFTESVITIAAPAPISGASDGERNTTAVVTGVDPVHLTGSVTVKYTRRNPTDHFGSDVTTLSVYDPDVDQAGVQKHVETMLAGRTIPFVTDVDFTFTAISKLDAESEESQEGKYQWKVTLDFTKNYVLYGSQNILVSTDSRPLSDLLTEPDLDGFTKTDVE